MTHLNVINSNFIAMLLLILVCITSCSNAGAQKKDIGGLIQANTQANTHANILMETKANIQNKANPMTDLEVPAAEKRLSAKQVEKDIALAKEAYERVHPGYTRYAKASEMNAAWQAIVDSARANKGMSVGNLYLAVQKTLTLIHCDHTKANLPKTMVEARKRQPVYLPFRWVWLEERAFITRLGESNLSSVSVNDEILEIDGRSIQSMVAEVLPYIPYDGHTHWSRNAGVAESLEFTGGAIDHFGTLLWSNQPTAEITVKTRAGKVKSIQVERINYKQWIDLAGKNASRQNFKDAVTFERVGEKAAYLKIDTFVNYRKPVKPDSIYNPIFKAIQDEGRNALILDLRQNGGGSSDASLGLFANLISEPIQAKIEMRVNTLDFDGIRQHLWTWDKRALNPNRLGFSKNDDNTYSLRSFVTDEMDTIEPAKYAFKGQIIALTSQSNSSGSTNLLANLQPRDNVTLVGEKTGGSAEGPTAGVLFTLTLPESKITTRIPFFRYRNNVENFEMGLGVTPDVKAAMTAEAYLSGEDPALKRALTIAEKANASM